MADLSHWAGNGNTESTNNYKVISPTSVGGTFQSRKTPTPPAGTFPEQWYLRDATLAGGKLGFDDVLAMSGTITLSSPNNADPSWFFGWYSSTDYRYRLGFSAAQAVPTAPNAIRMQLSRGNGGGATPTNLSSDGNGSALTATIPDGTYNLSFVYTPGASNNLTAHIQSIDKDWRKLSLTVGYFTPDVFDRFGFLQSGATPIATPGFDARTFDVTVSNLNYTGESLIPEPSAATLASVVVIAAFGAFGRLPTVRLCRRR
ncbi:MAG: hypothetical protein C0485_12590 [Pirellula sp.]|nr:hypothetical protein [Pirellula sp.]